MRLPTTSAICAALLLCGLSSTFSVAAEKTPVGKTAASKKAAELVTAALQAEAAGSAEARAALLKQAMAVDPDHAPARWHSGFVQWNGRWADIDDVPKLAKRDERFTAYRKRREGMVETAENHRELARWCRKAKLAEEERLHWSKVLEFEAANAEAIEALGLEPYQGRLLTRQQIEREKQVASQQKQAFRKWQPRFAKWRKSLSSSVSSERDEAFRQFRAVKEPEALGALEACLAQNAKGKQTDELNRLLIEVVSEIRAPEATQVLLRQAVLPDSPQTRLEAAKALKKRPLYAYMPALVDAYPGTIKTNFQLTLLPDGSLSHQHEVLVEGREADFAYSYDAMVNPYSDAGVTFGNVPAAQEIAAAQRFEARLRPVQQQLEWLRGRVQSALEATTGCRSIDDPKLWNRYYNSMYDWYEPEYVKPMYSAREEIDRSYVQQGSTVSHIGSPRPRTSCFHEATLVQTLAGARPIKELQPGDRVLVQDVHSAELRYVPVRSRTLRPSTRLWKIKVGVDEIATTAGHPFWVSGKGWQVAQEIAVGDFLHTLRGPVAVTSVEETDSAEAYNLVVEGADTYLVGTSGFLVHDNTPLVELPHSVPGLVKELK